MFKIGLFGSIQKFLDASFKVYLTFQEIEDFVTNREDRMKWSMPLYLANGTELTCLFSPIVDGAMLIRFHQPKKPVAEIENPEAEKPPQDA